MNYLVDVNVLLAWGWSDHTEHRRAASWIAVQKRKRGTRLLTSPIPELGFVRVSVQRSGGRLKVAEAVATLTSMQQSLGAHHGFLDDTVSSTMEFPDWCVSASGTTDAHLLLLARSANARLATLDERIPGAFLLPGLT